ncbi:MAG: hypothetical protein AAB225_21530 [Acidobacteriota bacterium]
MERENRCQEAGTSAWKAVRLREANRQRGFERVSLAERLARLAQSLGIDLAPILKWFGVPTLSLADPPGDLARFGRELDFPKDDLYLYIGIGEALHKNLPVAGLARGGARQGTLVQSCVADLDRLEWDAETRTRLASLKAAIEDEYNKP